MYLFYKNSNTVKEGFDTTSDIKTAINEVYKADVEAIRNLSNIATELKNTNGLTIAGDTFVKGRIYCKGGDAGGGGDTHFPYINGDNFIRGHTNHDGDFRANQSLTVAGNSQVKGNSQVNGNLTVNSNINSGTINSDTITCNKLNKKENLARYIRIGNNTDLRHDFWTLIKAQVYDSDGNNIALNKPVSILQGSAFSSKSPASNITNNTICYGNNKNMSDNWELGYHGSTGINVIQIDLGANNYISQIELYNRIHNDGYRMNGTTIELYDESNVRNRIIYTGIWWGQYSKTFLL
jgi:hypothetical protein